MQRSFKGTWCNGSTTAFEAVGLGSNPSVPVKSDLFYMLWEMKFIATIEITVNAEWSFFEQRTFEADTYSELFLKLNEYLESRWDWSDWVLVDLINLTLVV